MRRVLPLLGATLSLALLAGCSSSHHASKIEVHVTINHGHRGLVRYTLSCPPPRGNLTRGNAANACKTLASIDAMIHPPKMTATCAGSEGIPPEVSVKGKANGEPVDFSVRSCDEPSARAQAARDWLALFRPGVVAPGSHKHFDPRVLFPGMTVFCDGGAAAKVPPPGHSVERFVTVTLGGGRVPQGARAVSIHTGRDGSVDVRCRSAHGGTIALTWDGPNSKIHLPSGRARFLSPTRLAFVTAGSGSCPELPTSRKVLGPHVVRFRTTEYNPTHGPCTMDLSTKIVQVAINPHRVDVHHALAVQLVHYPFGHGRVITLTAPGLR